MTAEIQLRTIAIDFWAALAHQIKYKQNVPHGATIKSELKRCADEIASVDISMQTIRDILKDNTWDKNQGRYSDEKFPGVLPEVQTGNFNRCRAISNDRDP